MIPRQNARRFGARAVNLPVGKTLYHGTLAKLTSGFPTSPGGNWFATNPKQSILHVLSRARGNLNKVPYLYIYKVIRAPRLIKFTTSANFNAFAKRLGFTLAEDQTTFAYSNANLKIAKKICTEGLYDGWWFEEDQTQVMLCDPSKFLRFVKVLEIKRPAKGYVTMPYFREGRWGTSNINKITTVPVKLNNIININQPSSKVLYAIRNPSAVNGYNYYDVNGNPVTINKSGHTFKYKGKNYLSGGGFGGVWETKKANIILNRIKAKTGASYKMYNLYQQYLVSQNNVNANERRRAANRNYMARINAPQMNVNINASALYKNV